MISLIVALSLYGVLGDPVLDRLLGVLEGQQRALENIHVDATCMILRGPRSDEKRNSDTRVLIWSLGIPKSKMRADFRPEVCESTDGSFVEDDSIFSFNGRVGFHFQLRHGIEGQTIYKTNQGQILPNRPVKLEWATEVCGWTTTTLGFGEPYGTTLAAILRKERLRAHCEESGDEITVKVGNESVSSSWVFSKKWKHALRRYQRFVNGVCTVDVKAYGFIDAGVIAYPMRISAVYKDGHGEQRSRREITCQKVIVNDPDFSERIFTPDFPPGATLVDRASGSRLVVGPNERELDGKIAAQVERVARLARAGPVSSGDGGGAGWPGWLVGAMIAVLLLLLGKAAHAWRHPNRKRASKSPMRTPSLPSSSLVAILGLLPAIRGGQNAESSLEIGIRELPSEKLANCAVNVTCFTLRYLSRNADSTSVARDLDCGRGWERTKSLASIARTLRNRGLRVDGFQNAGFEQLYGLLNGRQSIAILHMTDPRPHFILAVSAKRRKILVVDVLGRSVWVGRESEAHRSWLRRLSGYGLAVSKSDVPIDLCRVDTVALELGTVDVGKESSVVRRLPVLNRSESVLEITSVKASCSCVVTVSFEKGCRTLPPRSRGQLVATFDKSKWQGTINQALLIGVQCGSIRKHIRIDVRGHVSQGTQRGSPQVIPSVIELGRIAPDKLPSIKEALLLQSPINSSVKSITTKRGLVLVAPRRPAELDRHANLEFREYAISFAPTHAYSGSVSDEVLIDVAWGGHEKTLHVPVTAFVR